MKHVNCFLDKGLKIELVNDDNLKIEGLSSLQGNVKNQVIEYAKKHKWRILFEVKTQDKTIKEKVDILWNQANKLADWIDDADSDIPLQE